MEYLIRYIADLLWDWPLIVTILSTGVYFTVTCDFFQIKYFGHIFKSTLGSAENGPQDHSNALTTLETFCTAIATTTGVGNITGVASAIVIGGPGAVFWLLVTGLIGMIIKMAEVTLAVYYRDENQDGSLEGGPMQYIEKGIGISMNFGTMRVPIAIFCIGIMSTLFITIQNYQASSSFSIMGVSSIMPMTLVYVLVLYYAIFKGIKSVSRILKIIVPIVAMIYIGSGISVLLQNLDQVLPALRWILTDAFSAGAVIGGVAGKGIGEVIRQGVSRAVYSNEAGWGTTPMIHAKASTDHPIKNGFWGAVEVFFDTFVVCLTTGLVVVVAMASGVSSEGFELVVQAFSMGIGDSAKVIIPITMFLFGLTTSIGWYSYYETIFRFIGSRSALNVAPLIKMLKYIYPLPGLGMALYVSKIGDPDKMLWVFSDILAGLPTFVNIFAVLILSNKFFDLLRDYKLKYIDGVQPEEEMAVFFGQEDPEMYDFL